MDTKQKVIALLETVKDLLYDIYFVDELEEVHTIIKDLDWYCTISAEHDKTID